MFDVKEFLRFVVISFITAPPNFKWQQLLERSVDLNFTEDTGAKVSPRAFPAYERDRSPPLPLTRPAEEGEEDEKHDTTPRPRKLNIKNTLTKWFIDCITMGALLNTVAFILLIGVLKGQAKEQIAQNIRTETFPIIFNSYKIWPIASIISFSFVPAEKRIVFLSCVGLLWGVYMSLIAASI
ncbi:hypothetical protein LTS08_005275 [Lithohypha guttulata]|uniref:Mpv17-like protein n=1 Tax=Lithohypha guttulata TaxID=1690604 RepID=A0AAN7YAR7_9EURO|nr:hypothetical protein LTR51_004908 [Lithohypha guttulata]KAK5091515.1 hypothetical protein LTR05_001699 [Lithohypha guttulata]KAK5100524.1 hypothetical protein LTS08_005275 [Lithohypha guttulata]